jgi:hypothetical protein
MWLEILLGFRNGSVEGQAKTWMRSPGLTEQSRPEGRVSRTEYYVRE